MPISTAVCPPIIIEQGYVAIEPNGSEVRIRRANDYHTLTVKSGGSLERSEHEVPMSQEQFNVLWPTTLGRRITKQRFQVPLGDNTAELDIYQEAHLGLAIVEVEFATRGLAKQFTPPTWFGKEVTHDITYKNRHLAS